MPSAMQYAHSKQQVVSFDENLATVWNKDDGSDDVLIIKYIFLSL